MGENVGVRLFLSNPCCAGHRLISINSTSLEGVSHHAALEILENAPEDVTLVISQPKDKLSKGSSLSPVSNPSWFGLGIVFRDRVKRCVRVTFGYSVNRELSVGYPAGKAVA